MGQKVLARITISMDVDGSTESPYSHHVPGSDEWDIHLRPLSDALYSYVAGDKFKPDDVSTVLAHELGHMMAEMLKAPEHNKNQNAYYVSSKAQTAKEIEAWKFADLIKPDLNQKMKNDAIQAYKNVK